MAFCLALTAALSFSPVSRVYTPASVARVAPPVVALAPRQQQAAVAGALAALIAAAPLNTAELLVQPAFAEEEAPLKAGDPG